MKSTLTIYPHTVLLCTVLLLLPLAAQSAQFAPSTEPPTTLAETWLDWQQQRQTVGQPPFNWAYSFVLPTSQASELAMQHRRLIAELDSLAGVLHAVGQEHTTQGLTRWAQRLSEMPLLPARSPEPLGLLALTDDMRRNLVMTDVELLGTCQPPSWVEVWTFDGVERIAWQPGLTLDDVLKHLSRSALLGLDRDYMTVITPRGNGKQYGIAAWNYQDAPLAPGARLAARLTERYLEAQLINRGLATFLATRLPGDSCSLWQE